MEISKFDFLTDSRTVTHVKQGNPENRLQTQIQYTKELIYSKKAYIQVKQIQQTQNVHKETLKRRHTDEDELVTMEGTDTRLNTQRG